MSNSWSIDGPFASGSDANERSLRRDAGEVLRTALEAVNAERLVGRALRQPPAQLSGDRPIHVLAVGKAAAGMLRGAAHALGDRIRDGILVVPRGTAAQMSANVELIEAGHPVPDEASLIAGRAALRLARSVAADDVLLFLLSGGGSALLALPPDSVSIDDMRATTELLLRAGASVSELNAVRKHLDLLKGGRLAHEVAGDIYVLAISDVIGDPPEVIASGPVSPDSSTFTDAVEVLRGRGVWEVVPERVRRHLGDGVAGRVAESPPPDDECFARVCYCVVGGAAVAAAGAASAAQRLGYHTRVLTTSLAGEARRAGAHLARLAREARANGSPPPPACLVAAGETTVTVFGDGKGGRNQELALSAAVELSGVKGVLLASIGTDGIDGPTEAAGALVTGTTMERAQASGLDAFDALARNDSYPFFAALGDLVRTGPTGTNVMDLHIVLVSNPDGDLK